jgi:predicted ATPase
LKPILSQGSFLYAAFGAPIAHTDDPARAVAAAFDLQSLPAELDFITAQIGLGWGQMRTGAYGSRTRRNYGVIGDEAILAARLMTSARPGQILLNQRVADALTDKFQLVYIGPIPVKGKIEPVPISMVKGRRPPSLPGLVSRFADPLVGRGDELAQLERILAVLLNGQEQMVWLEGMAGIGKSHLASEFAQRAVLRGVRVALGACQSTSQDIAYYPWRQIFRALFALTDETESLIAPQVASKEPVAKQDNLATGQIAQVKGIINDMNPQWLIRLPLLGDLLGLPIPDNPTTAAFDLRFRHEALIALAVELLQCWAQAQPLLLLIEDAHWLDEASLELTWALSQAIINVPLLLALVRRPSTQAQMDKGLWSDLNQLPYSYHLTLGELSAQGLAALVSNRLQAKPSDLALSLIQAQAQGNPFYAEELVDVLRETGDLYCQADGTWTLSETMFNTLREANCLAKENGQWLLAAQAPLAAADLELPDSIHGIVLSRLDRLPEAHKTTLKAASVIGPSFEFEVLLHAHPSQPGRPALLEQIAMLEERGFLRLEPVPRLTYMFRHNITQEVTYETLLESQQQELHQIVGTALEGLQPEAIQRLAHHYYHGRVRDKAMFYLDKAARKTQREYANETTLNYYRQALELEERWPWRKGQVEVLHILGRREEEEASLRQLEANPAAPIYEVTSLWGQYYETTANYPEAQAAEERALKACRDEGDLVGEIRCLTQLGLIARRQGGYDKAKLWYNQGLTLFEAEETYPDGGMQAFGRALDGLGTVHRQRGDFDQAQSCYKKALALSHMTGDRWSEASISVALPKL